MMGKQLTALAAALLVSLPSMALAGEVEVQAGNVRINTTESGGVSVDTGLNGLNLDSSSKIRADRFERKRYCNRRRSSRSSRYARRYRCYYSDTYKSSNSRRPRIYRDTTILEAPTHEGSSRRVRTIQRQSCSGNSTYSHQSITQSNGSGSVRTESSISTSGCN
jgi:hypothetical protein